MNAHTLSDSPFHVGEQALQAQVGKRERMEAFGRQVIRDHMPDQHRQFYATLPFLVAGAVDDDGNPWATLLTGRPGFIHSPDEHVLHIAADARPQDPVINALRDNAPVGLLGIDLATRRRNRLNGRVQRATPAAMDVRVDQAFGNCPQYIQARTLTWTEGDSAAPAAEPFRHIPADAHALVAQADTFFVSSYVPAGQNPGVEGVDVSHRGGRPGFVHVDNNTLTIPDFRGNNHFNTLGNFVVNPLAGLVFADFSNRDLLQLTGAVKLLTRETPEVSAFTGAQRAWQVQVTQGQWLRNALPFRFGAPEPSLRNAHTGAWRAPKPTEETNL